MPQTTIYRCCLGTEPALPAAAQAGCSRWLILCCCRRFKESALVRSMVEPCRCDHSAAPPGTRPAAGSAGCQMQTGSLQPRAACAQCVRALLLAGKRHGGCHIHAGMWWGRCGSGSPACKCCDEEAIKDEMFYRQYHCCECGDPVRTLPGRPWRHCLSSQPGSVVVRPPSSHCWARPGWARRAGTGRGLCAAAELVWTACRAARTTDGSAGTARGRAA